MGAPRWGFSGSQGWGDGGAGPQCPVSPPAPRDRQGTGSAGGLTKRPPAALAQDAGQVLLALSALVPVWDNYRARGGRPGHGWAPDVEGRRKAGHGRRRGKLGQRPPPAPGLLSGGPRPRRTGRWWSPSCLLFRLRLLASRPPCNTPAPSRRADRARRPPHQRSRRCLHGPRAARHLRGGHTALLLLRLLDLKPQR